MDRYNAKLTNPDYQIHGYRVIYFIDKITPQRQPSALMRLSAVGHDVAAV